MLNHPSVENRIDVTAINRLDGSQSVAIAFNLKGLNFVLTNRSKFKVIEVITTIGIGADVGYSTLASVLIIVCIFSSPEIPLASVTIVPPGELDPLKFQCSIVAIVLQHHILSFTNNIHLLRFILYPD